MATFSFIVFMVLGYVFSNLLRPKNDIIAITYALIFPILFLMITVFTISGGNGYIAGQITAQCFISTIATIILMLVMFMKKTNKK